jgi:hypothetical protein
MTELEIHHRIWRIRIAVSFLGEKNQAGWWRTSFLNTTGFKFIERLFPKTSRVAAIESAAEAAKRVHDEAIGKGQVCHLFRFAPEFEETLHGIAVSMSPGEIESICASPDAARRELDDAAEGSVEAAVGPKQIGALDSALHPTSIAKLAAHYLSGFDAGTPVFPYFA